MYLKDFVYLMLFANTPSLLAISLFTLIDLFTPIAVPTIIFDVFSIYSAAIMVIAINVFLLRLFSERRSRALVLLIKAFLGIAIISLFAWIALTIAKAFAVESLSTDTTKTVSLASLYICIAISFTVLYTKYRTVPMLLTVAAMAISALLTAMHRAEAEIATYILNVVAWFILAKSVSTQHF